MIQRERMNGDEQTTVTFVVPAPAKGEKLSVAGDFNGWDAGQLPMTKRGKKCSATAMLDTGRRYAFRYVSSDGRWFDDEAADGYEPNELGTTNSIIDLTGQPVDA